MPPSSLLGRLKELAEALPDFARDTRRDLATKVGENPAFDRLVESVADRCRWTLRSVFGA
ncbi:MAG: hypothetical protein IPM35_14490 [Myxococcales bacterium]|nr:hypothetical protein [Myxococcales bacterium]